MDRGSWITAPSTRLSRRKATVRCVNKHESMLIFKLDNKAFLGLNVSKLCMFLSARNAYQGVFRS